MKLSISFLFTLAALTAASPVPEPDATVDAISTKGLDSTIEKRSYAGTCWNCALFTNPYGSVGMTCDCWTMSGREQRSSIFPSFHIGNGFGRLVWDSSDFQRSCRAYGWTNPILSAECNNGSGGWVRTSINLDERIHNSDGNLVYL